MKSLLGNIVVLCLALTTGVEASSYCKSKRLTSGEVLDLMPSGSTDAYLRSVYLSVQKRRCYSATGCEGWKNDRFTYYNTKSKKHWTPSYQTKGQLRVQIRNNRPKPYFKFGTSSYQHRVLVNSCGTAGSSLDCVARAKHRDPKMQKDLVLRLDHGDYLYRIPNLSGYLHEDCVEIKSTFKKNLKDKNGNNYRLEIRTRITG